MNGENMGTYGKIWEWFGGTIIAIIFNMFKQIHMSHRQTDRQKDEQTYRQIDKHKHTHTYYIM